MLWVIAGLLVVLIYLLWFAADRWIALIDTRKELQETQVLYKRYLDRWQALRDGCYKESERLATTAQQLQDQAVRLRELTY